MKKNEDKIKISFVSLGCDKNLVDSEVMLNIIEENNYQIISDEKNADVIIINTCGFIMDATEEGIENILTLASYKINGNCKALIVTGCMAQRYKEEIFKELPEVDAVIGTGEFSKIADVINKCITTNEKITLISDVNTPFDEKILSKRKLTTNSGFAYLKIAEGCDKKCTYCTIPSLRGKFRSRTMESLIEEAENLAKQDVKELIIVAQDTALYGIDLYGESKLHELLNKLSKIEDIEWIRILYCYPEHITDELINEIKTNKKICHYIDMPIQHSDNFILQKMARQSNTNKIKTTIEKLRKNVPDICIRTTLIVGFPGETEEHFNNLANFVSEMEFDRLGVFTYSQEEGTPAATMPNQIDDKTKNKRKDFIMELQNKISAKICEKQIGKTLKVIVEGKLPDEDVYCARSYRDCYEIDGYVFFNSNDEFLSGDFVNVKITHSSEYDLIGGLVDEFAK